MVELGFEPGPVGLHLFIHSLIDCMLSDGDEVRNKEEETPFLMAYTFW